MAFETLAAELVLDSSGFSQGVDQAENDLQGLEDTSSRARENIAKLGAVASGVGAVGLAASAKAASDYETAMTEVAKVTSEATAEQLNSSLLELSKTIPLTATELSNLAEQAGRFGIEGEKNINSFVETTAKMAEATDMNASAAGEAFARLATLTETPISQIENLGSSINTLSNNMATSSQEIVDSMLRSSGALTQLGASNTEIVALSGALNAVSESSERAGSRLRRVAQEIQSAGAQKIPTMSKALGITQERFKELRANDPTQLIRSMAQTMGEGGNQARALGSALSTTSRQGLSALGQNLKGLDTALKSSNQSFESATSLQEEFDKAVQTTAAQAKLLRNEIVAVAITTGQQLLPHLTSAIKALRGMVSAFSEVNTATNGMAGVLVGLVTIVGGLATAFAALSPQIMAAAGTMSTLAPTIAAIAGPAAAATTAIIALGAAVSTNFGGIRDDIQMVGAALSTEFSARWMEAKNLVVGIANDLANAFGVTASSIESSVDRISTAVATRLVAGIRAASTAIEAPLDRIELAWKAHGDAVIASIENTIQGATTAYTRLREQVGVVVAGLQTTVEAALTRIEAAWAEHGQTVQTALTEGYLRARVAVATAVLQIREAISQAVARIETLWNQHGETIQTTVVGYYNTLRDQVETAVTRVRDVVSEVTTRATELWNQHGATVERAIGRIRDAITPILEKIRDLGTELGFLDEKGRPTAETLGKVAIAIAGLTNPITTVIGAFLLLKQSWDKNIGGIRDSAEEIFPGIQTTIKTSMGQIQTAVTDALTQIQTYWDTRLRPLIQQTEEIFSQIAATIGDYLNWIWKNSFTPILNSILQLWQTHGQELLSEVVETYTVLEQRLSTFLDGILSVVQVFVGAALEFWNQWGDEILIITKFAFDTIGSVVNTALDVLLTTIGVALDIIQGDWGEAWNKLAGLTERILNGIISFITKWGGGLVETLRTWFTNAIDGVVSYLTGTGQQSLIGSFVSLLDSIILTVADAFKAGGRFFLAFAAGITAVAEYISSGQAVADMQGAFEALGTKVAETVATIFSIAGAIGTAITEFFTSVADYISSGQAYADIQAAFKSLGEGIRTAVLAIFNFGKRLGQIIKDFFAAVRDYIANGQAMADLTAAFKALGEGLRAAALAVFTLGGVIGTVITEFFTSVADYISSGQALTDLKNAFTALGEGIKATVAAAFSLGGTIGTVITDFVTAVADYISSGQAFSDLKAAFEALTEMIMGVLEALYEGLIGGSLIRDMMSEIASYIGGEAYELIQTAVQSIADRVTEQFTQLKEDVAAIVTQWFTDLNGQIDTFATQVNEKFTALKDSSVELWTTLKDRVVEVVTTLKDRTVELVTTLRDRAVELWTALKDRAVEITTELKDSAVDLFTTLKDRAVELWTTLKDRVEELTTTLKESVVSLVTETKDRVTELITTLKDNAVDRLTTLQDRATEIWNAIKQMVADVLGQILQQVRTKFENARSAVESKSNAAKRNLKSALDGMFTDVKNVLGNIVGEFEDKFESVKRIAGNIVEEAQESVRRATSILSGNSGDDDNDSGSSRTYSSVTRNRGSGMEPIGGGSGVQAMASGGRIDTDGLIYAHAGEQVLPAAQVDRSEQMGGGGDTYRFEFSDGAIVVDGGGDPKAQARELWDELKRIQDQEAQRFGTSTGL